MVDSNPELAWQRLTAAHRDPNPAPEPEHSPAAAILACSDAQVPPSVIFDQLAGSLFVVRHAGNTARPGSVASLDCAVHHLDVALVVMGHTGCGAVTAVLNGPGVDPVLEPKLGLSDQPWPASTPPTRTRSTRPSQRTWPTRWVSWQAIPAFKAQRYAPGPCNYEAHCMT